MDYSGYSKQPVSNGWRIKQQTQFNYKLRLLHPWAAAGTAIFNNEKSVLFITKFMIDWNLLVGTNVVEVHLSGTLATADSIFFFRANMMTREQWFLPFEFDPPLRFDRLCYILINNPSTGATEQLNALVWGYSEEL